MAVYEVQSLDTWGNPIDGYDVNNSSREGQISLPPDIDIADEAFWQRLIDAGYLSSNALELLRDDELTAEEEFEYININQHENAWVAVEADGGGEPHYLDARNRRDAEELIDPETQHVEEMEGWKPIIALQLIEGRDHTVPFFRQKYEDAVVELKVDLKKLETPEHSRRSGRADINTDVYVDGDFFRTMPLSDIDDAELGYGRNGKLINGSADLLSTAKVALDAFFDHGGVGAEPFLQGRESLLPPEAKALLKRMRDNVDDHNKKRIDFDVFGERSRALWDEARKLGGGLDGELAQILAPLHSPAQPHTPPTPYTEHPARATLDRDIARRLRVGDHVRFRTPASKVISNYEINISGMSGEVTDISGDVLSIRLDSDEYAEELSDWDNEVVYQMAEGEDEYPQLETVEGELAVRNLAFKPCGLNADWSVQAWMLTNGSPNRVDGAYYLLDTESDRGTVPQYVVVRRYLEELEGPNGWEPNPAYVEHEGTQGIEEIISDGPLTFVLDEFMGISDADR